MNISKALIIIVFVIVGLAVALYMHFDTAQIPYEHAKTVTIQKKWELPEILDEVSGIVYFGDQKIAAVQDEKGIIFIYNLNTSSIEKEIPFGEDGDYEGITLVGNTAYVLKSDGTLSQVANFMGNQAQTTVYESPFKKGSNFEGLCYDRKHNRLLLALKENGESDSKPVYAFDLTTKTFNKEPVFTLRSDDPILATSSKKKKKPALYPSEINIHPETGKVFILEGVRPKLLILDAAGTMETLYVLDRKQFPQAEGLTFGSQNEVFISNEGSGGTPNLLHVKLN
ncbi:MAG: SdiA-regulated domain-containing protein [Flavobacteriaceae bacterium]